MRYRRLLSWPTALIVLLVLGIAIWQGPRDQPARPSESKIQLTPISMPQLAPRMWESVQHCSGITALPGALQHVQWLSATNGGPYLEFLYPHDTIALDPSSINDSLEIGQRLLRYLLAGPPASATAHRLTARTCDYLWKHDTNVRTPSRKMESP